MNEIGVWVLVWFHIQANFLRIGITAVANIILPCFVHTYAAILSTCFLM